jgi:hypothetical protein
VAKPLAKSEEKLVAKVLLRSLAAEALPEGGLEEATEGKEYKRATRKEACESGDTHNNPRGLLLIAMLLHAALRGSLWIARRNTGSRRASPLVPSLPCRRESGASSSRTRTHTRGSKCSSKRGSKFSHRHHHRRRSQGVQ